MAFRWQGNGHQHLGSVRGSDDAAVVDGDFAMPESELQPVLRAMRKEGINIVAIHQHMSHEQPAICSCTIGGRAKPSISPIR